MFSNIMKNKLKILIAIECYPPYITGSGIATMRLAAGLAKRGHKVVVACAGTSINHKISTESNVVVHRVGSIPLPIINAQGIRITVFPGNYIKNILNEFNPDILHIADHFFISGAAASLAKKKKIKVVGTNHYTPNNWLDNLKIKNSKTLYRISEKLLWHYFLNLYDSIDAVTVPSEYARKIVKNAGLKKPVRVISNGVMLEQYNNKSDKEILTKYNIDKNKIIFLSASRLDEEKRVDILIEALSRIKDKIDFNFIITGSGKEKKNLEKLSFDNNLSSRVVFTDFVSDLELKDFYSASDIFLTASEVELQGLSIMEAMASGLSIIAANSMAIPELVEDGINGFLFEPGNAKDASEKIIQLANDKKLRKKMSLNSLKIIGEHDFNTILDKFEELYYGCA
jgi:glycosyltransferase involved in cell wall biosynthesis